MPWQSALHRPVQGGLWVARALPRILRPHGESLSVRASVTSTFGIAKPAPLGRAGAIESFRLVVLNRRIGLPGDGERPAGRRTKKAGCSQPALILELATALLAVPRPDLG